MNKQTIVQAINDIVSSKQIKSSKSITSVIKKNREMVDLLHKLYPEKTLLEQCYLIYNDYSENPKCSCGNFTNFQNWFQGYGNFCSVSCASKENVKKSEYQINRKIHYFDKECVTCGSTFSTNKMSRIACSKSCGHIHAHKVRTEERKKEIDVKRKDTCLERYGNEYVINSDHVRRKTEEKLGVKYAITLPSSRESWKNALLEKYGEDNPMKVKSIVDKMIKTKIERYGSLESIAFKYKLYIFPSGRTVKVQGYEDRALDILLEKYNENDILIGREITRNLGDFIYVLDDKHHRYYPDVFIISENKVIEVKSNFTFEKHSNTNNLKKQSVIDRGFNFEFMIL